MTTATAEELVVRSGVDANPALLARATDYLVRARRARWIGFAGGVVLGFGPMAGEGGESLLVPRLLAGYLFGVLLSDLLTPTTTRGGVRAASLHPRSAGDLVPRAALALPWLTLLPLLATPLLALGWHPHGVTRLNKASGDGVCSAYWPHTATLFGIAGLAAISLVLLTLTLRRLSHRPQPAEDAASLRLDRVLRARSARAAIAAATALGLTLLNIVGESVYQGTNSYDCTRPMANSLTGNVYSWAGSVNPWLQNVSLLVLLLAIPAWMICQRLPLPARTLSDA